MPRIQPHDLRAALVAALDESGQTDSAIARRIGKPRQYIYEVRTGRKATVPLETAAEWLHACGRSLTVVIGEDAEQARSDLSTQQAALVASLLSIAHRIDDADVNTVRAILQRFAR